MHKRILKMVRRGINWISTERVFTVGIRKRVENDGIIIENQEKPEFKLWPIDKNYWYADPMLFSYDGKDYLFCEVCERQNQKGAIGVVLLDENNITKRPSIVLREEWHLSYPCVFELNSKIYMIPESTRHQNVALYEAVRFPDQWELRHNLPVGEGVHADATLIMAEEQVILLTFEHCGSTNRLRMHAYNAQRISEGILDEIEIEDNPGYCLWIRGAGNAFVHNGSMIRPSQESTESEYGCALRFMEVRKCSTFSYCEAEIARITLNDFKVKSRYQLIGTHSYAVNDKYEIIDVRMNNPRIGTKFRRIVQKLKDRVSQELQKNRSNCKRNVKYCAGK